MPVDNTIIEMYFYKLAHHVKNPIKLFIDFKYQKHKKIGS